MDYFLYAVYVTYDIYYISLHCKPHLKILYVCVSQKEQSLSSSLIFFLVLTNSYKSMFVDSFIFLQAKELLEDLQRTCRSCMSSVHEFFQFFSSLGNVFILPLFLKDIFSEYRILGWKSFLQHLKDIMSLSLVSMFLMSYLKCFELLFPCI